jgi:hypothetical protein
MRYAKAQPLSARLSVRSRAEQARWAPFSDPTPAPELLPRAEAPPTSAASFQLSKCDSLLPPDPKDFLT